MKIKTKNRAENLHYNSQSLTDSFNWHVKNGKAYGDDKTGATFDPLPTCPTPIAIPTSTEHKRNKITLANFEEDRVVYKTTYKTGRRPTGTLLSLAKSNGVVSKKVHDSKIELRATVDRDNLTWGSGFNSKTYHMPCEKSFFTWRDMVLYTRNHENVLDVDDTLQNPNKIVKTVASVLSTSSQYMLYNQSSTLPANVKIHVLKINENCNLIDTSGAAETKYAKPFVLMTRSGSQTGGTNQYDGFPDYYNHGGTNFSPGSGDSEDKNTAVYNLNTSLKLPSLKTSDFFRNNCQVIETFSKHLKPGDFWNFRHIHSYGPGVDLDMALLKGYDSTIGDPTPQTDSDQFLFSSKMPVTYAFLFEVQGTMCEGIYKTADAIPNDQYLGISPTFLTYEFKNSITYVLDDASELGGTTADVTPTTGSFCHQRRWITDPSGLSEVDPKTALPGLADKEIFVLNSNIKNSVNLGVVGTMYIPSFSDNAIVGTVRTGGENQ